MFDLILDTITSLVRYGLSWVTLLLVIVALFKNRKLRKKFNRYLPPLLRDEQDSEVGKYIQNQARIESKIDALLAKEGVLWSGDIEISLNTEAKNLKRSFDLLQKAMSQVNQKGKWTMNKLKSRKLWMALLAAVLPVINEQFGLGFNTETIIASIGAIAAYILGEAHVDAKRAQKGTEDTNEHIEPTITIESNK